EFNQQLLSLFIKALADQAMDKVGINIAKICMLDLFSKGPNYTEQKVGYWDVDLIGPDSFSCPARISWYCKLHFGEMIRVDTPIEPDQHDLVINWEKLPVETLQKRYAASSPPSLPDGKVSFQIDRSDYWNLRLPDLSFAIVTKNPVAETQLKDLEQIFWKSLAELADSSLITRISKESDILKKLTSEELRSMAERGYAKYWSGFVYDQPNTISVTVDFLLAS